MTTKKKKPFWVKLLSAVLVASMLIGNAGMSSFAASDSPDEKIKMEESVSNESAGGKENTAGTSETGAVKDAQDLKDTDAAEAEEDAKTAEGADISDTEGNLQSKEETGTSDVEDNQQSKEEAGTSDVEESLKDKAEGDVSSETGDENAPSDVTDTENGGVTEKTDYTTVDDLNAAFEAVGAILEEGNVEGGIAALDAYLAIYNGLSPEDQEANAEALAAALAYQETLVAAKEAENNQDDGDNVDENVDPEIDTLAAAGTHNIQIHYTWYEGYMWKQRSCGTEICTYSNPLNGGDGWGYTIPSHTKYQNRFPLGYTFDHVEYAKNGNSRITVQEGQRINIYGTGMAVYFVLTHTHQWSGWKYNSTQHWKECTICGEKKDQANHSHSSTVHPANCYEGGYTSYSNCTCGYSKANNNYTARLSPDYTGQSWYNWNGQQRMDCRRCGGNAPDHYKTQAAQVQNVTYTVNHYYRVNGTQTASYQTTGTVAAGTTIYGANVTRTSHNGKEYIYNSSDSTYSITLNANGSNILNLYYDRTEDNKEQVSLTIRKQFKGLNVEQVDEISSEFVIVYNIHQGSATGAVLASSALMLEDSNKFDEDTLTAEWTVSYERPENTETYLEISEFGQEVTNYTCTPSSSTGSSFTLDGDVYTTIISIPVGSNNVTSTITNTYTTRPTKVTVTWVDEDGTTVLDGPKYFDKGGTEPTTNVVPTKAEDENNTYKFKEWERSEDGEGNIIYRATYTATPKPQTPETKDVKFVVYKAFSGDELTETAVFANAVTKEPVVKYTYKISHLEGHGKYFEPITGTMEWTYIGTKTPEGKTGVAAYKYSATVEIPADADWFAYMITEPDKDGIAGYKWYYNGNTWQQTGNTNYSKGMTITADYVNYYKKDAPLQSNLTITKRADKKSVQIGDTVEYTITVENTGKATVAGVKIVDVLNAEYLEWQGAGYEWTAPGEPIPGYDVTSDEAGTGIFSSQPANGEYAVPDMKPGMKLTMTITAKATKAGIVENIATVKGDNTPDKSSDKVDVTVTDPDAPVEITKTAGKSGAKPGETVMYTVTITNRTDKQQTVIFKDDLAGGKLVLGNGTTLSIRHNGSDVVGGVSGSFSDVGATFTLAAKKGAKITFEYTARVAAGAAVGGTVSNKATVTVDGKDYEDKADVTVTGDTPDTEDNGNGIEITKTRTSVKASDGAERIDSKAQAGDEITWNIVVTNKSNVEKTVTLTEQTGVTLSGDVLTDGNKVVLEPAGEEGDSRTVTAAYTVTGNETVDADGKFFNTVKASTGKTGEKENPEAKDGGTEIDKENENAPKLTVEKTADNTAPKAGETVTYSITVTNTGDADAQGVKVTDELDENLTFESWTLGDTESAEKPVDDVYQIGELKAGESVTLIIRAAVREGVAAETEILNTATGDYEGKPEGEEPKSEVTITVEDNDTEPENPTDPIEPVIPGGGDGGDPDPTPTPPGGGGGGTNPEPTPTPTTPEPTPIVPEPVPTVGPVQTVPTVTPVAPTSTVPTPTAALASPTPEMAELSDEDVPLVGEGEEEEPETVIKPAELSDEAVPMAAGKGLSWALINFALMNLAVFESLMLLIGYFIKTKGSSEEDEEERKKLKKKGIMRIISLPVAVISVIAFILTEDITLPTAFVDRYTILMAIIAIIQTAVVALSRKEVKDEEDQKAEA